MPGFIQVVIGNWGGDPGQEAAFNDWYNQVHIPDVLSIPGFAAATRYRIVGEPREGQGKYLALYEIEGDLAATRASAADAVPRWRAQGRILDGGQAICIASYQPTTDRIMRAGPNPAVSQPGRPRSRGVFIVGTNCADPALEEEFNDFYNNDVVPDALTVPGFVSGTRYQLAGESQQSAGRFLALYEIEADDVVAVVDSLGQAIAQWRVRGHGARGRHFQGMELVYAAIYEAITERITA